ncbi:hypothetical protein EIP91_011194 [Steccherinum ochraceum]|uniref:DUF6534 domain-containing protein n=1 Tax=Steccherinum ochraceum TaxID=92696 RepID=A0A4R0R8D2_9APHY|nr:hypothetical protein EIP91_011194 [Steccherinum ochraceum]
MQANFKLSISLRGPWATARKFGLVQVTTAYKPRHNGLVKQVDPQIERRSGIVVLHAARLGSAYNHISGGSGDGFDDVIRADAFGPPFQLWTVWYLDGANLYYIAFPRDGYRYKTTVGVAYVLEIAQVVVATCDAFRMYASAWGDVLRADKIGLYWLSLPLLTAMISAICQFFYAWRIYALGRDYRVAASVYFLSIVQLAFGLYDCSAVRDAASISALPKSSVYKSSIMWSTTGVACNLLITCSMFYYLWQAKKSSPVKRTHNVLSRFILYTIETGFFAMASASVAVILFLSSQTTSLYVIPFFVLSKLYSNCLLAVLNARFQISGGRDTEPATFILHGSQAIRTDFTVPRPCTALRSTLKDRHENQGVVIEISHITDSTSGGFSKAESLHSGVTQESAT